MANPVTQESMGKYLWYCLRSLEFQPEAETSNLVGKTVKHINLGVRMFDKPNKDAYYIVTHFLLHKLDPTRFNELYRHCWPIYDRKADAEFRKITLSWLRDIMDENSESAPKVLASLFLSPGGPSFTALMLRLAKHVMLQEMKTFTTDGSWNPMEAAKPTSSLNIAMKRLKLAKARFLKSAIRQDNLLQDYQRRAQNLVKSIEELQSEGAKYDQLLKCHGNELSNEEYVSARKINEVRTLWSAIDKMLLAIQEGRRSVTSMMDDTDPTLDGAELSLKIPPVLLERIQRSPQQLSSGKVYEGGQLNLLCVLELMNHALQLLTEERSRVADHAALAQLRPQELQACSEEAAGLLEDLKVLRQKLSEKTPALRSASLRLDADWDRRWQETLSATPLASFLSDDPALCFLSPMAPLSFEPANEAMCSAGVFSRYAAKLGAEAPGEEESLEVAAQAELDTSVPDLNRSTVCPAPLLRAESPAAAVSFIANSSLEDLLNTLSPPPHGPSPSSPPPVQQVKDETVLGKAAPTKNKAKILDREFDNLASQYAEIITKTSPTGGKWRDLDNVLCSLGGDPFSTRKQLLRTPESLTADVKSSRREAVDVSKLHATSLSLQPYTDRMPASARSFNTTPCIAKPVASTASPGPTVRPPSTSLVSPLAWASPGIGARNATATTTGRNSTFFSLDDETLPDMASSDSLLSLSDEDPDRPDADLLLLSPFTAPPRNILDLDNDDASFRGTGGWLLEPDAAVPAGSDTLISLDQEGLTSPRQLPKSTACPSW